MTWESEMDRASGADSFGPSDDVTRFLADLRALGQGEPPAPSPEVAALLGVRTLRPRRPLVRAAVRTGLVAAAIVTVLVSAAANHSLPRPAERVVSHVVNVLTPFQITPDRPAGPLTPSLTPTPSPTPTRRPAPVVVPPAPTDDGAGASESSAAGGDARSDDGAAVSGGDGPAASGGGDGPAASGDEGGARVAGGDD